MNNILFYTILLIISVLLTQYNQPWAFFSSPTRAWEFGVGGLVSLIPYWRVRLSSIQTFFVGGAGLSLIMFSACYYDTTLSFPGVPAVIPVLGAAMFIGACHGKSVIGINRWLSVKPMQFIGDISYSFYLWHWPVFVFMNFLYTDLGYYFQLGGILISFILAWVTTLCIEKPFRFNRLLTQRVRASIALGFLLSISSASFALVLRDLAATGIDSVSQQRYFDVEKDIPRIYAEGCHAEPLEVDMPDCIYGDPLATKTIVLFGDSHAAQWFPALEVLSIKHKWRLISLTKSACPSMIYEPFDDQMNRFYFECTEWRKKAFEKISKLKPHL